MDKLHFDHTDYSVVVKNRAPPPSSWKWEIYRAGRSSPVSRVSRLHMLPREKIEAEIAYLEIVGRKDGRQRHCSDLA
jgi:hypothetical protein